MYIFPAKKIPCTIIHCKVKYMFIVLLPSCNALLVQICRRLLVILSEVWGFQTSSGHQRELKIVSPNPRCLLNHILSYLTWTTQCYQWRFHHRCQQAKSHIFLIFISSSCQSEPVANVPLIDHPWVLPTHLTSSLNLAGGWDRPLLYYPRGKLPWLSGLTGGSRRNPAKHRKTAAALNKGNILS